MQPLKTFADSPLSSKESGALSAEPPIRLCEPEIRGNAWQYVKETLDTSWVSSAGSFVNRFEQSLADYVGAKFAVATASGTAALHVALLAAGVRPDDEVLVSALTFIAPANAIRYAGAWPVFIDAEKETWQMDPELAREFLRKQCQWKNNMLFNNANGRRISAVVPVHILGHAVNIDPLLDIAREYGLAVVEDATESLGACYKDRPVGHLADIACFSFNGNKIITTGGGGMVVTDNEQWARRVKHLTTQAKDDSLEYIHNEIGFNYRLTNIQAALGCAQMENLDEYIRAKRTIAKTYTQCLADVPGILPMPRADWCFCTWWLYTVLVKTETYGINSRTLLRKLGEFGIESRPLWQPVHRSKAHEGSTAVGGEVAEALNRQALSLPSSVGLDSRSLLSVCHRLREIHLESLSA
jgi:perosamine synthetase